jgi:uncharacterized protein YwqG
MFMHYDWLIPQEGPLPPFLFTLVGLAVIFGLAFLVASWLKRRRRLRAPRITAAEIDAVQSRLSAATLPAIRVSLSTDPLAGATASRIGGSPFADSPRRKWPVRGEDRQPMLFLAQINFADTPPLEDFPRKGLLQLFGIANKQGHLQGLDRSTDRVIRWYPEPEGTLTLAPPEALARLGKGASLSPRAIRQGLGMQFEPGDMRAHTGLWPYDEATKTFPFRLPDTEETRRKLDEFNQANERILESIEDHWIGGHPNFVQGDVRYEPRLRKLNRVLLHLAADDHDINLGDSGELNLLISRKDLRNSDFDKAFCTWDCC